MKKMEFVKREIAKALDGGVIRVGLKNYVSHSYVTLNNDIDIALITKGKTEIFYPYSKSFFNIFKNNEAIKNRIKELDACEVKDKVSFKEIMETNIYFHDIEWSIKENIKNVIFKILLNMYYIAFAMEHLRNFKKMGIEVKKGDYYFKRPFYVNGNIVEKRFNLKKLWEEHVKLLKYAYYNLDIVEKYPDKICKLKEINIDFEDFQYNFNKKEEEKEEEGC